VRTPHCSGSHATRAASHSVKLEQAVNQAGDPFFGHGDGGAGQVGDDVEGSVYPEAERLLRTTVVSTVYGGTSEIQRDIIGKTYGL
jgi:hypothetical protein